MASAPQRPASSLPASVRRQIAGALVDAAAAQVNAQLDGLVSRLAQALQETGTCNADPESAALHAAAAGLLRKNRYPFAYLVGERLRAALHRELRMAERGVTSQGACGGAPSTLPPDVEVDKTLCLARIARAQEQRHGELLTMVGLRLAALFGRAQLGPARNPFRPSVFLHVLHEAWCEFHPDTAAHALLYPLLKAELCLDPGPILQALNKVLTKYGLVPQLGGAGASAAAEPEAGAALPAWLDALPCQLAAAGGAGEPAAAGVLRHVRRHAPEDCMAPAEAALIERLIALFDAVLGEAAIAAAMRAELARLQLPLLRVALAQRALDPDQPPCRVLALLAELAPDWDPKRDPGCADPVWQLVKQTVERIAGAADPADAFAAALPELESFMRQAQSAAEHAAAAPIAAALTEEKRRQAEQRARHQVALRVGTGEVVAFVEAFLEDKWVQVLTLAYELDEAPRPDPVKTMDDLVWSVKPKITPQERRALLDMLPGLVAALNHWLDRIQWSGPERRRFFDELVACHASLVRAPLALSPELRLALAVEIARQAAERRLARQASRLPESEPDAYDRQVRELRRGAWLEFAEPGGMRRLKLVWISPMGSAYLFVSRTRAQPLTLSDEALAAALREGRARIVDAGGLVRRILGAAANEATRSAA